MKMVSLVALAGALACAAAPAAAQKKKEQAAPQLQISDQFRKPAAAAELAIKARDWATSERELAAAEAVAANDEERYYVGMMLLQIGVGKNANETVARAADMLLVSPKTPPEKLAVYNLLRGNASFNMKKYAEAIPFLLKARQLGAGEPETPLFLAQSYDATGRRREGVQEMIRAIDEAKTAGRKAEDNWYNWAVSRLYNIDDRTGAAALTMRQMRDFPTAANWRKVFVIYRDGVTKSGVRLDRAQKIDIFRLMRATGALADQNDYFEYARETLEGGLPWEALAVLAEGRAAGKIPTGGAGFAEIETKAKAAVKEEGSLDGLAREAAAAADGRTALGTADAFLASGNYARALELYDLALQKGGANAEVVNLRRGMALVRLGRKDEARTAFGQIRTAPLSDIAGFWVVSLDLPMPLAA